MTFKPRKPQQLALDAVLKSFATKPDRGALVVLPTGVGKTGLANWLATQYLERGFRVVWVAHRKELVRQPYKGMRQMFPDFTHRLGVVRAEEDQPDADMVYCSKDTIKSQKRMDRLLRRGRPALVIVDEAHHSVSPTWLKVIAELRGSGPGQAHLMGLTATPEREDEKDLSKLWDIVYAYSILEAFQEGILLQPWAATVDIPDLDLTKVSGRTDYNDTELWAEMARVHIVERTVEAIKQKHVATRLPFRDAKKELEVGNRSTLVFTASVEQARQTSDALRKEGLESRFVSGETPDGERRLLLDGFERGDIQYLCNAQVLTEGTDLPRASAGVIVRPTKSRTLYVQIAGRVMRTFGEQDDAFLLDLAAGVTQAHSLITAPVLIAGGCPVAPNGEHYWMVADGCVEGVCNHCQKVVPCGRRGGPHKFKEGYCVTCGQVQCPMTPDHLHVWVPHPDQEGVNVCAGCALEIPDRIKGLIGKKPQPEREPAAWQRLKVPGEVWAVQLGAVGTLFQVRRGKLVEPIWVAGRGGGIIRLSPAGPVDEREASHLCVDVLRKVDKINGLAGGQVSEKAYKNAYQSAEQLARKLVIWS